MFIVFLLLVILIFIVKFLKRRYDNPYTLCFIFGKKGSGKSCLMVHHMKKYLKKGWLVYTDMQDCRLDGVRIINADDLKTFVPVQDSFLALEEVGITFDNRNFKNFDNGFRDFFKFQRKYRVRCVMNSQSFDIDLKIRSVVDSMILQTNILNCISVSRPIRRSITLTEPSAERDSRIADRLRFGPIWTWHFYWMPHYFKYFDSFSAPPRQEIPYRYPDNPYKLKRILQRNLNRRSNDGQETEDSD